MRLALSLWNIACGIVIIIIIRNPPPKPPDCLVCGTPSLFIAVTALVLGAAGLVTTAIARRTSRTTIAG